MFRDGILGVLFACAGALFFWYFHLPLPFILGALVGSAISTNLFGPIRRSKLLRRSGQVVIGTAVGSLLTPQTIVELARALPLMLGVAFVLNGAGVLLAFPVSRIAGVDRLTALLSCLPAGMAEMSSLARDLGAKAHVVATVHALRVILLIATLPLWLGLAGAIVKPPAASVEVERLWILVLMIVISVATAYWASTKGVLNPWVVTPMILGLFIVALGGRVPAMPQPLLIAAQVAIGAALGARFDIEALRALPRATMAGVFSTLSLAALAFLALAPAIETLVDVDADTAALSVAPGGLGEMIASAKALGLASASVAGFQFVRALTTNVLVPPIIRLVVGRHRAAQAD